MPAARPRSRSSLVGRDDLGGGRVEGVGHGAQRGVLVGARQQGQPAGGGTGGSGQLGDLRDGGGIDASDMPPAYAAVPGLRARVSASGPRIRAAASGADRAAVGRLRGYEVGGCPAAQAHGIPGCLPECTGEHPVDPVLGRLRPRRQLRRRLPPAAPRRRGVAGAHRALLQPHRLRRSGAARCWPPTTCARSSPGIEERGAFPEVDAVLSGYQGGEDIGDVILDAVARVKAANPAADLRLRPGDGQRQERLLRAPGDPGAAARAGRPGGRPHHPEPVRARLPHRDRAATLEETLASVDLARDDGPVDGAGHQRRAARPRRRAPSRCWRCTGDGAWIVQTPRCR